MAITPNDMLTIVRILKHRLDAVERAYDDALHTAIKQGYSIDEIATAAGVSRQAIEGRLGDGPEVE